MVGGEQSGTVGFNLRKKGPLIPALFDRAGHTRVPRFNAAASPLTASKYV